MVQLWFQLPTFWQKPKKKEEEQMMSKAPMMSVNPSVKEKQPVAPQMSTPVQKAGWIPTKPMMSYNIEGTILSWVADDKATKILDYAKKNAKTPEEEKLLVKDMHTEAIKMEQKKMFEKDRAEMKAQIMKDVLKEPDPVKQKQMGISIKLAEFADTVRDWSISQWIDPNDNDDQSVSTKFIEANPQFETTFTDFVNWKITNVDLGKQIGLIPTEEVVVEEDKWWVVKNVVWWAYDSATGLPRFIAQNLAKWVWRIAKELWADETKVQWLVDSYIESLKDFSWEAIWADTESWLYKGTKMVWDIAQIANPAWLWKAGIKAGQIASKVWKSWKLLSKVAKWAAEWVVDTAIFMPQSEQRMATKWELAWWAIIGWAIPAVWAAASKVKQKIWEFWTKLYSKTIKLNPSQIKKIAKNNVAWVEPERRLIDKKISWNLSQIQSKLDDIAENSYKDLNAKAASIKWEYPSESWKTILSALKKKVDWIEGLEDINTKLDWLISKDKYSLTEMFDIKRTLDKRISMYSKSWDPLAQETAEWLRNLRDRLRKDIDWIAESQWLTDLRKLSKDIQVSTEISNALENTIARESKNRIMSLTDLIVWWSVAWWVYASTSDPLKSLQTVAGLLITKKVFENPAIRTKLAIQLDKLTPKTQNIIKNAIQNNKPLQTKFKDILKKALVQAWVKVLPNKQD